MGCRGRAPGGGRSRIYSARVQSNSPQYNESGQAGEDDHPAKPSFGGPAMISASQFKKGIVITFEGAHWTVEDYHTHKTAQRRPVLQTKLRHLKTGHVVERAFDEADKFEQPDLQSRTHQFLYRDGSNYVFMNMETFDQITVPSEVIGTSKWLLKEGAEFVS